MGSSGGPRRSRIHSGEGASTSLERGSEAPRRMPRRRAAGLGSGKVRARVAGLPVHERHEMAVWSRGPADHLDVTDDRAIRDKLAELKKSTTAISHNAMDSRHDTLKLKEHSV